MTAANSAHCEHCPASADSCAARQGANPRARCCARCSHPAAPDDATVVTRRATADPTTPKGNTMTDNVLTYNDGCPECGRWKEWPVRVDPDGTAWVECYKCGYRWQADPDCLTFELELAVEQMVAPS